MLINKITVEFLEKINACGPGVRWFEKQRKVEPVKVLRALMNDKHSDWANWLIVRLMTYKQYVSYAVLAAEQVLDIYEARYPDDKNPRKAIEAAKKCIEDPSKENKAYAARAADTADAAARAADTAYAAARAADAYDAARDAAYAARAADTAYAAARAAYAADAADTAYAAARAAARAAYAADAARKEMRQKILNYGIKLLEEKC